MSSLLIWEIWSLKTREKGKLCLNYETEKTMKKLMKICENEFIDEQYGKVHTYWNLGTIVQMVSIWNFVDFIVFWMEQTSSINDLNEIVMKIRSKNESKG